MEIPNDIGIVIVLYNPTEDDLRNVYAIAAAYKGAVVDNSSCPSFQELHIGNMQYIPLGENGGVAEAQNVALRFLMHDEGIQYFIFLDQDSRINVNYPRDIIKEYRKIRETNYNLALLGPTVENIKTGKEYHSVIHKIHKSFEAKDGFIPCREIISSGSAISRGALEEIGLNDASLFIDFVDFELCWRAESKGYVCGITRNVHISHKVGIAEISLCSYKVIVSAPVRYFYQYRNHLWLCHRGYVPLQWKIATGVKHVARLLYFPLFVSGGWPCWKKMLKGIRASSHSHATVYE